MSIAVLFAFILSSGQAVPAAPAPLPPADYAPPPVRPFEPPANFAVRAAEGAEATARPWRRALEAPVSLDAYGGDYEATPTDAQAAYAKGVAQAELTMDARMGPLDGRWRLIAADGRALAELVLFDSGQGVVEGGWRALEGPGRGAAAAPLRMSGQPLELVLDGWCVLRLAPGAGGAGAVMIHGGAEHPVRLERF